MPDGQSPVPARCGPMRSVTGTRAVRGADQRATILSQRPGRSVAGIMPSFIYWF